MALVGEKVLLVVDSSVWAWSGDDWVQQSGGATFPASSLGAVLATRGEKGVLCDPVRGPGQSPGATTAWELDGLDWVSRSPLVTPIDVRVGAWASLPDGFALFGKAGLYGPASFETIWIYSSGFANGSACSSHADCDSGYCVDDVCCDSLCGDSDPDDCQACSVAAGGAVDGTCTHLRVGTVCRPATCTEGAATAAGLCGTDTACPSPSSPVACAPYLCRADACGSNCAQPSDCAAGFWCDPPRCRANGENGFPCASDVECTSGHCVGSICCDSVCPGQCEACDVADHRGTCSPVTGPPRGAKESCAGTGACQGQCDGTNRTECAMPGASAFCAPAFCAFGSATPEAHCDGQGACGEPTAVSCGEFGCNGTRCHTTCLLSADCAPGRTCVTGSCIVVAVDAGQSGPDAHSGTATEPRGCGCSEGNAGPLNAAALALLFLLRQLLFHSVTRRSARVVALRR